MEEAINCETKQEGVTHRKVGSSPKRSLLRNIRDTFLGLDLDTLGFFKTFLIFFMIISLVLFYWYLNWKELGKVCILVCILFLSILLLLERRLNKMEKQEDPKKVKEESEEEEEKEDVEEIGGMNIGLPSSEEYNKRVEKAFGTGII